jgi:hypothetical protein
MLEDTGPELHQYLVESDTDGRPFKGVSKKRF